MFNIYNFIQYLTFILYYLNKSVDMTKAINQNDLVDIIRANIEVVTDTLNIIKNSNIKSVYTSISAFKADANLIFQSLDYIGKLIIKNSGILMKLADARYIKRGYKNLHESLTYLKDISALFLTYKDTKKSLEIFDRVSQITDIMVNISKNIAMMVLYLPLFSSFIASSPIIFSTFGIALQMIGKLTQVAKYTITRFLTMKLFALTSRTIIKGFNIVINIIKGVTKDMERIRINPVKMLQILWCVNILNDIVGVLRSIHTFFLIRRIKRIRYAIIQLQRILTIISKMKHIRRAMKNIFWFKLAIDSLFSLMLSLTIMSPIALLFVAISPVIMLCMLALSQVLNLIGLIISKSLTKKSVKGLKNLTIAILAITAITLTLIVLSKISPAVVAGLPLVIIVLMGLIVVAGLIKITISIVNKFSNKRTVRRLTTFETILVMLTAIAGTLILLTVVASLALIGMTNLILFMGGLILVSAGIWLLLKIVKHLTTLKIVGGLLILAGLIASIIGIGYLLIVLSTIALVIHTNFWSILLFIGELALIAAAIGVLGFAVATLGVYSLMILAGLVLLTTIVGLIYVMGKMLLTIQKIKLDKKTLKSNIKTIIESARLIIDAIFETTDVENTPSNKTWIGSVLTKYMTGAKDILEAIMAVGFLATSFVSISMLILLAKELSVIQGIELNRDSIYNNVNSIIGTALNIINSIFQKDDTKAQKSPKGFLNKLISKTFPQLSPIMDAIMSVGFLAISVASVGMVGMLAKHLTSIQNLPSMSGIDGKVNNVIVAAKTVIDSIFTDNNGGIGKILKQMADSKKANLMLNSLLGTVSTVNKTGIELVKLGKLDINSINNSSIVTDSIVESINKLSNLKINNDLTRRISSISRLNSVLKDITFVSEREAANNTKVIDNYVKFIDKLDKIKIDNISKATSMFKEMARFSESINGNFDQLAESLNERIAPLLEELKEILEKIPNNITESSNNISNNIGQSITNNAAGPLGWNPGIIQQNANNFDESDREQIIEEMERKSMESKADNTRIVEVLNDILDALTGQGAYSEGIKIQ